MMTRFFSLRRCWLALLGAVLLWTGIAATAQDAAKVAIPVTVQVPDTGLLSLGLYDAKGMLVRSLLAAQPVEKGTQTLSWDATTDLGVPVSAGSYQVKGVWFPAGPKMQYKMKVGVSGNPPYILSDGTGEWGGNLGGPMDICGNGTYLVGVFGCVESPQVTGVQLMDGTGNIIRRYQSFFPWDVRFAGALDAKNFYLALANIGAKRLVIGKYDINNPRGKILADIPTGAAVEPAGRWKGRWTTDVRGLAVADGRLYITVLPDNKLFVVDAESGKILRSVDIPSPRGVQAQGGAVYVVSGQQLLQLDRDGNTVRTVIATGLDDPSGLAIDAKGNFYLADGGQAQRVKVFTPQGKPLRALGIAGGRPATGRFNPAGMRDPRGLALGPDGNVWVAEGGDDYQRISVWNARSGKLTRDFDNIRISSGLGMLSPDHQEMICTYDVYADSPGVTAYTVNLPQGRWAPSWHLGMPQSVMQQEDTFLGNTHDNPLQTRTPYLSYAGEMVKATNGRTYLTGGEFSIWLFDEKTLSVKLAAFVYTHRVHKNADGRFEGDYDQGPNNWLAWADLNGDGKMAVDECRFTENHPRMTKVNRLFTWKLQPDLSILMLGPDWVVRRLPVQRILPSGAPVYDWADLQDVVTLKIPSLQGGDGWKKISYYFPGGIFMQDGNIYVGEQPESSVRIQLSGVDGDGWWGSRNWRQTTWKFDAKTGEPAWIKLGRRAPGRAKPGEMYYPWPATAAIDGFVFVPDCLGQMWAWTDTGLFIGKLYRDSWEGIDGSQGIYIELVNAYVYKEQGKLYTCAGDHGVSVHELTMPTLTPVDGGTVAVSAAQATAALPWDPDGPMPGKKPVYTANSSYDFQDKQAVRTITVDGTLNPAEWSGVAAMPILLDDKPVANVRATFDESTLYLAYEVTDAVGPRNAGTELPYSPFTSGSYVDFCLGRDWTTPNREGNQPGDVRVILARITGEGVTGYQMGFWPLKQGGANPQTITSPAAQRHFDDITPVNGLRFAYAQQPTGYTVEVSVPFAALGIRPTGTYGFDASVGFANAEGTLRVRAAHWGGLSETNVVDRPGSAALLPATWGTLTLDRSPLPAVK